MASTLLFARAEQCPWRVIAGNIAAARRNGVGVTRLQQAGDTSERAESTPSHDAHIGRLGSIEASRWTD